MRAGNVPTAEVGPVLERLIHERWPDGGGHDILAEKADCDLSAIATIIEQQHPGVSFDLADRLFCALGQPMEHVGLADVYHAVTFVETCAAPGCNKSFAEYHRGGKPKRTCSKRCSSRLEAVKLGRTKYAPGARVMGKCNRGHKLTPDNVKISKATGFRRCRICAREGDRARASQRREAARAA